MLKASIKPVAAKYDLKALNARNEKAMTQGNDKQETGLFV